MPVSQTGGGRRGLGFFGVVVFGFVFGFFFFFPSVVCVGDAGLEQGRM